MKREQPAVPRLVVDMDAKDELLKSLQVMHLSGEIAGAARSHCARELASGTCAVPYSLYYRPPGPHPLIGELVADLEFVSYR